MMKGFIKARVAVNVDKAYRGNVELMINSIEELDYKTESDVIKSQIVELTQE